MDKIMADAFANGAIPKIETQKDEEHGGQDRYFWVLTVENVKMYVKVNAYADHLGEPRLDVVSCHKSLS